MHVSDDDDEEEKNASSAARKSLKFGDSGMLHVITQPWGCMLNDYHCVTENVPTHST